MKLLLEEQETIIRWDRANPKAIVYTFDPALKRKLSELKTGFPDKVILECEDNGSVEYTVPKNLISVRKPTTISDKTRNQLIENGKMLRHKKDLKKRTVHSSDSGLMG